VLYQIALTNFVMGRTLFFILIATSLLTVSLMSVLVTNRVHAENPSSCLNLYDSTIESLKIKVGSRTIDAAVRHHPNFVAELGKGYDVELTLHSTTVSNSGNKEVGSVWFGNRAYGFASDQCVNGVNSNTELKMTFHNVLMGQATHGTVQDVSWYSWPLDGPSVAYTVRWK
jgi:hypothetical protein